MSADVTPTIVRAGVRRLGRSRRVLVAVLVPAAIAMSTPAIGAHTGVAAPPAGGFTSVTPARLMDTRIGGATIDQLESGHGALGEGATTTVQVAGRGGVPAAGVSAVALNVTAVGASADTFITVFPGGTERPLASNLNPSADGSAVPNTVVVALGSGGEVSLFNNAGTVDLVVDVFGYFLDGSVYTGVTPTRLMDSRLDIGTWHGDAGGALGGPDTRALTVVGHADVPSDATAVALNVTAVDAGAETYLTLFPAGSTQPLASAVNPSPGRTSPTFVIAAVGADGKVAIYNNAGSVHLVVDVLGWFRDGPAFTSLAPGRVLDTRSGAVTVDGQASGGGAVAERTAINLHVLGRAGVPPAGVESVVLDVTAVDATAPSFVTVWSAGRDRPWVSNLNTAPARVATNLVIAKVSAAGDVALYNNAGAVHLVADVVGWFAKPPAQAGAPDPEPDVDVLPAADPDPAPPGDPVPAPGSQTDIWLESSSAPLEQDVPGSLPTVTPPLPGIAVVLADATMTQAGGLPVSVALVNPADPPVEVRVQVFSQVVTTGAGAELLLARISPTSPLDGDRALRIELDYSGFADAYGGGWSERLGVVEIAPCGLSVPADASCAPVGPVASRNDFTRSRVLFETTLLDGTLPIPSDAAGNMAGVLQRHGGGRSRRLASPVPEAFGLLAGAAGSTGNFAASPLAPSASWSAGGNSGGFTWSYPLTMPVAIAGVPPDVSIGYSSQAVDGITSEVASQASQTGLGWDLSAGGFIQRRYTTCAGAPDHCWAGWNASIVLDGVATELIPLDDTFATWRLRDDNGWRVQRLEGGPGGSLGDGTVDVHGEYWTVTEPSGVRFTFGFGREGATSLPTNSVWTVPVVSPGATDPCHGAPHDACQMAWRWNLDRVEDPNGNVTSYVWSPELNRYGAFGDRNDAVQYASGGSLQAVAWTKRAGDEAANAPARLDVVTEQRCIYLVSLCPPPSNDAQGGFPDVPTDLICAVAPCKEHAPTFFSTRRVKQVVTSVWEHGAYRPVDAFTLAHEFVDGGDGAAPKLWLRSIQRTGLHGGALSLPPVRFESLSSLLPNRHDAAPAAGVLPVRLFRVDTIRDELGGELRVTYGQPDGCASGGWADNTTDCYPGWWSPTGGTPGWAVWNRYVVTEVVEGALAESSPPTGPSIYVGVPITTRYEYVGGAAWHFEDRGGAPTSTQTWADWRGYAIVRTTVGDPGAPGPETVTETRWFRGMHGDRAAGGGTKVVDAVASASLDGAPGVHTTPDEAWLAGQLLESRTFDGAAGPELSGSISEYEALGVMLGTGPLPPADRTIRLVVGAATHERRATGADRYALVTSTYVTHDPVSGLETQRFEAGAAGPADDRCTLTAYDPGSGTPGTLVWDRVVDTTVVAGGCGSGNVASHTSATFDTAGNPLTATTDAGMGVLLTTSLGYSGDPYGRPTSSTDARHNTTSLEYLPNPASGFLTDVRATNPLGQQATVRIDAARGSVISTTNVRGHTSTATFDALGRMTSGRSPSEQSTAAATVEYRYLPDTVDNALSHYQHGLNMVETRTLLQAAGDPGNTSGTDVYTYAYAYVDGLGRTVETQTASPRGGRLVTDSSFDDRGLGARVVDPRHDGGQAGDGPLIGTLPAMTEHETRIAFDGAARPTSATEFANGAVVGTTTTSYTATTTTVTPPTPGAASTITTVDPFGRTVRTERTGQTAVVTAYDARDLPTSIVTGTSAITYGYDLAGRRAVVSDPDAALSYFAYDANGNVTSTTDAKLQTITTAYDALNRPTSRASGLVPLASWTYDGAGFEGLLRSSTSHQADGEYTTTIDAYDDHGRPLAQTVTLPSGVDVTTSQTFDRAGNVRTSTMAPVGAAPQETVTTGYDRLGLPVSLTGAQPYVTAVGYDIRGRVTSRSFGSYAIVRSYAYDVRNRIEAIVEQVDGATVVDDHWTYDAAANVTAIDARVAGQRQCFDHDAFQQLVRAYTTASGAACNGTADLGAGPAGYDTGWSYGPGGDIAQVRDTDGTIRPYRYADDHPHAPVDTEDATFAYDANGARVGDGPVKRPAVVVPVTPTRIVHTPSGVGGVRLPAGGSLVVPVAGLVLPVHDGAPVTVPADVVAAVVNVIAVDPDADAVVSVFPTGAPIVNGQIHAHADPSTGLDNTSNLVTVPVAADGSITIRSSAATDVIVDIDGFYTEVDAAVAAGRYQPVAPTRVYDSRVLAAGAMAAGEWRDVSVAGAGVPADALGVLATLTVTDITKPGYFSVVPAGIYAPVMSGGPEPPTSTLNVATADDSVANQIEVLVPVGSANAISVFSHQGGDVVIDVVGYVTGAGAAPSTSGIYVSFPAPSRIASFDSALTASTELPVAGRDGVAADAVAVVVNATEESAFPGYLSLLPGGTVVGPDGAATSVLNTNHDGVPVSAHAVVNVAAGGVTVYSSQPGHVSLDVVGYYASVLPPAPTPGPVLTWDAQHRLASATTPSGDVESYSYDAGGRRVAKHAPDGSVTYYVGATELKVDAAGVMSVRRFYRQGPVTVAMREIAADGSSAVTWLGADVQGSQTVSVAPDGTVGHQYYTPFGDVRGGDENPTDHGHLGQVEDATTGFTYLNARFYDPATMVFLSVDPLVATTGDAYLYGAANPVTLSDPSGLDPAYLRNDKCLYGGSCATGSSVWHNGVGGQLGSTPSAKPRTGCGWSCGVSQSRPVVGPGEVIAQAAEHFAPGDTIGLIGDGLTGAEATSRICTTFGASALCGRVTQVTQAAGAAAAVAGFAVACATGTSTTCGQSIVFFTADALLGALPGGAVIVVATHVVVDWGGRFVEGGLEALRSNEPVWPNSMPGQLPNQGSGVGLGNEGGYTVMPSTDGRMEDAIRRYCAGEGRGDWTVCG